MCLRSAAEAAYDAIAAGEVSQRVCRDGDELG